ncbi:GNAT family N-acetyltransferase [Thalassobaculum salexigens]|uniref:Acetyltransferase (GNAT) domain-containing protein n=2 Tax=Thalassobaculum TaxID=526215 RepID=A0A8G2BIY2_9PROT|nr:GNAT family N-acetyltransferase [Thalassobaculum salexigens]SDF95983.1 Acetyltransferase (GNAT) domain-containing protein [Thalassobaculum litoreum DSM 18839]
MAVVRSKRRPASQAGWSGGERAGLVLTWDGVDMRRWMDLHSAVPMAPLEQAWMYGDAIAAGSPYRPTRGVVTRDGKPVAIVQALEWSFVRAARLAKVVRGPLFLKDVTEEECVAVHRLIADRWPMPRLNWLFFTPEMIDGDFSRSVMRSLNLKQTVTGYSTAWIDLTVGADRLRAGLNQKWRNQLLAAEGEKLRIRDAHSGQALNWLLARYDAERRRRRFRAASGAFAAALAICAPRPRDVLLLQAERGSEPLAGVLFLRHGFSATYQVAYTSEAGRAANANRLLLWEGMRRLAADGVRWLDLGGVDAAMEGVSRFKLGTGAAPVTLAGTWM